MSSKQDLVRFLNDQIKVEKKIVKSLDGSLKNIDNQTVKGVLKGISLDSTKHAEIYTSAIMLLTRVSKALTQENLDDQKKVVEKHIDIENELIEKIEGILPKVKERKVTFLLNAILADEKRHHELLKKVLEIIVKGETITEADWWDILWRDVPFHGAPGG